jgi:putative membrane protein
MENRQQSRAIKRLTSPIVLFVFLLLGFIVSSRPLYAAPRPPTPEEIWRAWNFDPLILLGLLASGWLYLRGMLVLRARTGQLQRQHGWRAGAFTLGIAALFVALISPLERLSSALLTAHMIQHVLLIVVAAPLLVASLPLGPMLLGLPGTPEQRLGRWWQRSRLLPGIWRFLTLPLVAWLLHAAAIWLWHIPGLYEAAVRNQWIHAVEHASFFGTALLLWWVVADQSRRASHKNWLATIGMLFTTALHSSLLGSLMAFAEYPWYPIYTIATAPWGLTPIDDQHLAGSIMWMPMGFVYLGGALFSLWRLLSRLESADAQRG